MIDLEHLISNVCNNEHKCVIISYALDSNWQIPREILLNFKNYFPKIIAPRSYYFTQICEHSFIPVGLLDKKIIRLLYQASIAGVKVDLLIRGLCSLRPGVPGVSENIRVISILGRYLEHSRVYYFHNSGQEEMFMGSADLMPRNLNRRVEVLFPIERVDMVKHIRENILEVYLKDNAKARFMEANGQYTYIHPEDNTQLFEAQSWFMKVRENNLREK